MALLLREALGDSLRRARVSQSRTLREVSSVARVSLGYLSEVERGRKEASSELLASICDALDVELADLLFDVSESMSEGRPQRHRPSALEFGEPGTAAVPQPLGEGTRVVIPQGASTREATAALAAA